MATGGRRHPCQSSLFALTGRVIVLTVNPPSPKEGKNRIALAPPFAQHPPMLARVLSAAVNGIEAFPVELEVNSGWGIRSS